ncbi:MAG: hypothetical protein J6T60_01920 [Bacteroidales bacterium]|nr:hypothetical protein [Bacteroidales bacterium]MBO7565843.1 hypothetical protein [Bacteroidales bacterium]MBP5682107.1 hypothetical protein [Bacteroidales bacterium]
MKNLTQALLAVIMLIMITTNASAQRPDLRALSGEVFYWFNVKISNSIDRDTRLEAYTLRVISPTIYNGNSRKFQKSLWEGSAHGTKIAIGPFTTLDEAKEALQLYKTLKDSTAQSKFDGQLSWFLIDVTIMERSHAYQFERIPARVAFGSPKEFKAALKESLTFKKLAVGPFYDNVQAEISKSLYRVEE